MTMTRREQQLAIAVGLLLLVVGGAYVYLKYDAAIRFREEKIARLQTNVDDKEMIVLEGTQAQQRIAEYQTRSLPGDANVARSLYKAWLLDQAEKKIKLTEPVVSPGAVSNVGGVYRRLSFTVAGRGRLEQLTEFLYDFYAVDYLHRIRTVRVKPIPDSKELEFAMAIEALVLPGAEPAESLSLPASQRLKLASLAQYVDTIVERNIFAPANHPPKLASLSDRTIYLQQSFEATAQAKDEDALDKVTYTLGGNAPPGASIDANSGRLQFRPSEVGTYPLTVVATDDGVPRRRDEKTLTVTVNPPRPARVASERPPPATPKPRFEDAKFAYVTAITEVNGRKQLWLTIRTSGELLKLHEGDRFQIERFKAEVSRIGLTDVDVAAGEESRRFELGENLSQGEKVPALPSASGE